MLKGGEKMLTPKYIDGHWEVFEDNVWGKPKFLASGDHKWEAMEAAEEAIAEREKEKEN